MNNVYHTDGYCSGNGSRESIGGFTVFKNGALLTSEEIKLRGVTSNECELRGLEYAIDDAAEGDEIVTDSMVCVYWARSGKPKARMDLQPLALKVKQAIADKHLDLYWVPRSENIAGIYNEESYNL